MKKTILTIICLVFLTSCASFSKSIPTDEEWANANFGEYPKDYKKIIEERLSNYLFDPHSMILKFTSGPKQMGVRRTTLMGRRGGFGYGVCVWVNAKNKLGGYTGRKMNLFIISNGTVKYHFFDDGKYTGSIESSNDIVRARC